MESKLNYFSRKESKKLGRVLAPVMQAFGHPRASRASMFMAASLLLKETDKQPNEWIYWYAMGDFYQALGFLAEGFKACQRCYTLRPQDPRSIYALAIGYRVLTRAKYLNDPTNVEKMKAAYAMLGAGQEDINPQASQQALDALGLTVDAAARSAYSLFQALLAFDLTSLDRELVTTSMTAMAREFPSLR